MTLRVILFSLCLGLLAGCASTPVPDVRRTAPAATGEVVPGAAQTTAMKEDEAPVTGPQAQIRRGNGQMINRSAASAPLPSLGGASSGSATFNFEGESVHAVVKAILGDMLGQNYVIAPGVQGTVTLGTPKPVSPAEAYNLLEMVLGWNNARLVYSGGRYNIIPADQALAGSVAPRTGPASNARGYEVRVVPLRFISASEMKKVLEPYARPNAIVNVDGTRNVITLAGTRSELENYLRTVEIFDVAAVRARHPRGGRPGKGVRQRQQDAQRRHVPFHAAGRRQRGAGDHPAAGLPGPDPAMVGAHRRRGRG